MTIQPLVQSLHLELQSYRVPFPRPAALYSRLSPCPPLLSLSCGCQAARTLRPTEDSAQDKVVARPPRSLALGSLQQTVAPSLLQVRPPLPRITRAGWIRRAYFMAVGCSHSRQDRSSALPPSASVPPPCRPSGHGLPSPSSTANDLRPDQAVAALKRPLPSESLERLVLMCVLSLLSCLINPSCADCFRGTFDRPSSRQIFLQRASFSSTSSDTFPSILGKPFGSRMASCNLFRRLLARPRKLRQATPRAHPRSTDQTKRRLPSPSALAWLPFATESAQAVRTTLPVSRVPCRRSSGSSSKVACALQTSLKINSSRTTSSVKFSRPALCRTVEGNLGRSGVCRNTWSRRSTRSSRRRSISSSTSNSSERRSTSSTSRPSLRPPLPSETSPSPSLPTASA